MRRLTAAAVLVVLAACACYALIAYRPTPVIESAAPAASPSPATAKPAAPASPAATKPAAGLPRGSGFDFYVLALSWSPSYCEAEGADANRQQCAGGRPYAFVVHGLWPQFESGYPQDCPTSEREVAQDRLRSLYDIMPSAGLIRHEWLTHGSCSGLRQAEYFAVLRRARQRVVVPAEFRRLADYRTVEPEKVEAAFRQANPGLAPEAAAVTCDQRYLREVRICLTLDLSFRGCPEVDRRACRAAKTVMPPVRG